MSTQTIFPALRYRDADAALAWLAEAFGAEHRSVYREGTVSLYIAVGDPGTVHARATQAGAEIVRKLTDTDYGSREFSVRDPEGNLWSFGSYNPHDH
ncbi:MAG: VOC family protein [Solirubrobacteraceae bacterium]